MAKRTLTEDEKILWKQYTKDVEKLSDATQDVILNDTSKKYRIKTPKLEYFKSPPPSLDNYESLENRDGNWSKKLKQGKAPIEGKLDLHGMTCVEAHNTLIQFFDRARQKGKRVVLIVTGKGGVKNEYKDYRYQDFENSRGVLKREVPLWLSSGSMRHHIVSFQDALPHHGGSGALYVVLKRA